MDGVLPVIVRVSLPIMAGAVRVGLTCVIWRLALVSGCVFFPMLALAESNQSFLKVLQRADQAFKEGHYAEAKTDYEEALAEGRRANVNKPDLAVILSDIAIVDKLNFRYEDAQNSLVEAIPLAGDDEVLLALLHTRLGSVLRARGNLYGALDHAKTVVELRTKMDSQGVQLAQALNNLAVLYLELKDPAKAVQNCDLALNALTKGGSSAGAEEAAVLSTKAAARIEGGAYKEARDLLQSILVRQEELFGKDSLKLSTTLNNIGMSYCKERRYKEAEPYLKRVLQLAENNKPPDIAGAADASASLADLYARMGERSFAESNFKKAIAYSETIAYRHLADIKDQYQSFLLDGKDGLLQPVKSTK